MILSRTNSSSGQARMDRVAFTLIELLVVIAIIVIIGAMLMPDDISVGRAKKRARQIVCMHNVRQIGLDVILYAGDFQDSAPKTAWTSNSTTMYLDGNRAFKKVLETHSRSNLFYCPADNFYFSFGTNAGGGFVTQSLHSQAAAEYSSYGFNGGQRTIFGTNTIGISGRKLSSIKHQARTVLVAELSAYFPWSWHEPRDRTPLFNDAKNVTGFVHGHVSFIKIYWNKNMPSDFALKYDPPTEYEYQWSGN